jgi:aryl-alcohol dehydrogenase-like predicted oxidoreductase
LRGRPRERVQISVKFGAFRDPAGGFGLYDARPGAVKNFLTYSLRRLRTDYIDIYRPARLDPNVPIEDTVGAIAEMVKAGYVRHIGLSEVGADTIRRAQAVHPICDLQIEYSLLTRGIEAEILPACRKLGIGISAYGILSRGLISGHWSAERSAQGRDFRSRNPRFQKNLERNLNSLILCGASRAKSASRHSSRLLACSRGADIVPVIGARRPPQLDEIVAALQLKLDAADLARIDAAVFPAARRASGTINADGPSRQRRTRRSGIELLPFNVGKLGQGAFASCNWAHVIRVVPTLRSERSHALFLLQHLLRRFVERSATVIRHDGMAAFGSGADGRT